MKKILVEILANTSCNGTHGVMPGAVKELSEEFGTDVEFTPYLIWDMDSADNLPEYISKRFADVRRGTHSNDGFFIDGEWFEQRPHNANDVIKIRQKFINASGLNSEPKNICLNGHSMDVVKMESTSMNEIHFSNSIVAKEMGSFSTNFEAVWFFEGSIKKLSIDACPVENFTYKGYDINKLIEIAEKNPELFKNKETGDNIKLEITKVNIDEVQISLLTLDDLRNGFHPCPIIDWKIDGNSKMYKAIAEKFGGWGYKAMYGENVCGWIGITTKDIMYKDRGYVIPCEIPNEYVLYLPCYMGGGNYAPQYHRIGIAKKMITQAISDAKMKGYRRVEAYPHEEIIPVLEKYGFSCTEIKKNDSETQKYYYYDII
jgi:hypothetical protein